MVRLTLRVHGCEFFPEKRLANSYLELALVTAPGSWGAGDRSLRPGLPIGIQFFVLGITHTCHPSPLYKVEAGLVAATSSV